MEGAYRRYRLPRGFRTKWRWLEANVDPAQGVGGEPLQRTNGAKLQQRRKL